MEKSKLLDIILDEWIALLPTKDRSHKNMKNNFEELFQSWKEAGATFDDLYDSLLKKAIKAHHPNTHIIKKSYKSFKRCIPNFDKTEKEFADQWIENINNIALLTFLELFKSPAKLNSKKETSHGNMSAAEYRAQRRYADQFPVLDTSELEERWRQQQYNLDVQDMIKNVFGETDETDSGAN